MPKDWVWGLESEIVDGALRLRWIDNETGDPMIEATATTLEVTLDEGRPEPSSPP